MSGLTFPPVFKDMVFPSAEGSNFAFTNKVPSHSASGVNFPSRISCSNSCTDFSQFSGTGSGCCKTPAVGAMGLGGLSGSIWFAHLWPPQSSYLVFSPYTFQITKRSLMKFRTIQVRTLMEFKESSLHKGQAKLKEDFTTPLMQSEQK